MSESKEEEIIGTLWLIAAVLAFGFQYTGWGYVFTVKAATDQLLSIVFAIRRMRKLNAEKRTQELAVERGAAGDVAIDKALAPGE